MMEAKKILPILAVLFLSGLVFAGVVTYLSNTVSAQVTTSSPIELTATATDALGNPVELSAITAYGGETITITVTAENKSNVSQSGKYTLTATPALETDDVSVDGVNVTSGELTSYDVATSTLTANASETKVITVTIATDATPQAYALETTYNVN